MSEIASLLDVEDLCICYGKVEAVHHASIKVGEGRIVTVIGPNGAGKTTLLSAIMGLLPHTRGVIRFRGQDLGPNAEVEQMVALGVGLVPESRALFGEMSVEDNLLLGAFVRRRAGNFDRVQAAEEVFQIFPRLGERRGQHAGTLSGGERQMLAVGRALMGKPRLLLLDEPSLGLAPLIVREIFRVIGELKAKGVAILLVEQNARAALQVADYAYVLEMGVIALEGPSSTLIGDPKVVESYLGLGGRHEGLVSRESN